MKTRTIKMMATLLAVPLMSLGILLASPVGSDVSALGIQDALNDTKSADQSGGADIGGIVKTVIDVLLYLVGALSVIMLIYGAIRYVTSGGNAEHVKAAKNTIMYAIVGLIVAIFAFTIVNWVLKTAGSGGAGAGGNSQTAPAGGDADQNASGEGETNGGGGGGGPVPNLPS